MVKVEVEGLPVEDSASSISDPSPEFSGSLCPTVSSAAGAYVVSVQTRPGLHVRKGNFTYQELKELAGNLEALC